MQTNPKKWVPYAEIVTALGVIVSLLFVGYELKQSNDIEQATTDNLLYQLQDDMYAATSTNIVLATSMQKLNSGEELRELTPIERQHYAQHLWRFMNLWELAHDRYSEGLLSESKWQSWDKALDFELIKYPTGMPRILWEEGRETYGKQFAAHIDERYIRAEMRQ